MFYRVFKLFRRIMYFKKTIFVIVLMITSSQCQRTSNLALFWNLYDAVVQGTRILSDVAEGVGAVTKAINAIDDIFDLPALERFRGGGDKPTISVDLPPAVDVTPIKEPKSIAAEPVLKVPSVVEPTPPTEPPSDVPAFTGCGALGFHIRGENLPVDRLMQCCSLHEACYGSACKVNKRECDSRLRDCLFSMCDKRNNLEKSFQDNCRSAAKLLFSGTMALSFQQYGDAQARIGCHSNKQKTKKKYK